MRIFRDSLILLLLLSFFVTTESVEANGDTYEVGVSVLHVREAPDKQSRIVGILNKGDELSVFDEKFGWVQTYYAGEVAWVAKHYLLPSNNSDVAVNEKTEKNSDVITITSPSVHIRSGPGTDYRVVAGTRKGEQFNQVDSSGDWVKISLPGGSSGWVASWLTSASAGTKSTSQPTDVSVASEQTEKSRASGNLSGQTIVLDAGHGGRDPGAIGIDGIYEKDLVLSTTTKLAEVLRQHGATVIETRTTDSYLGLEERSYRSNVEGADAFLSIHYNAFPVVAVQGVQTFYGNEGSYALAVSVHSHLTSAVRLDNRGMSQADYKVLRHLNAPGILLELGFITNSYDLSVVSTADYQYQASQAIAQGLINYFN